MVVLFSSSLFWRLHQFVLHIYMAGNKKITSPDVFWLPSFRVKHRKFTKRKTAWTPNNSQNSMEPQWFPRDPQAALLAELGLAYSGLEGAAQMLFACLFFYISPDAPGGDPPNPLKKYISSICWAFDLSFVANYLFRWKHGVPFYWTCQKVLGWCRSWWRLACPTHIFKNLDKWFKIIQTIWDAFVGATAAGSVSEDIRTNILGLDILSYKYYKHRYTKKRMKHWRTIPTGKMISTFWNLGISQCIPELFF